MNSILKWIESWLFGNGHIPVIVDFTEVELKVTNTKILADGTCLREKAKIGKTYVGNFLLNENFTYTHNTAHLPPKLNLDNLLVDANTPNLSWLTYDDRLEQANPIPSSLPSSIPYCEDYHDSRHHFAPVELLFLDEYRDNYNYPAIWIAPQGFTHTCKNCGEEFNSPVKKEKKCFSCRVKGILDHAKDSAGYSGYH